MNCCIILLVTINFIYCEESTVRDSIRRKLPLEALITSRNKDMVVSTLALRFSLCKLVCVADDDTKTELLLALGLENESKAKTCYTDVKQIITKLEEVDFIFLNKMYLNYTDDVDTNFITNSSEAFGVQVDKVGFNYPTYATTFINKWIDTATYKRITDIIGPNDITQDSSIVLVSAGFLKTTWEFPFDIRITKHRKFYHFDQKISYIPMMTKTDSFLYYGDNMSSIKALNVKMGPWGSSVTFILPQDRSGLPNLIKRLSKDPNLLITLRNQMRYSFTNIVIPKFKIKTLFEWSELLQQFGPKRIFNTTLSGLNGMLKKNSATKNVFISRTKQKNFVQVDEVGVFRHIEGIRMPFLPVTEPPQGPGVNEFIADRPFYFTINLEPNPETHYELFHGVFYGTE